MPSLFVSNSAKISCASIIGGTVLSDFFVKTTSYGLPVFFTYLQVESLRFSMSTAGGLRQRGKTPENWSSERNQSDVPFDGSSAKTVLYQRIFAGVCLLGMMIYSLYVDVAGPGRVFRQAEALVKALE